MLSTGKITEDISKVAILHGWDTYIAYGRFAKSSVSHQFRIGNQLDTYMHYAEHRLFDNEGLSSRKATNKLIRQIEEIHPDIIHLHNIHDHYLNYPLLFRYLATLNTPVVWTQHDCWAFTGGCMYYDQQGCDKWESHCERCPEHRAIFCDKTSKQYELKQELLLKIKNLTLVSVSDWLRNSLQKSFLSERAITTIHNGIDINVFKPTSNKVNVSENKFKIIGCAAVWDKRKGLEDFLNLHGFLPSDYEITLVGLTRKQVQALPTGINGITRTTHVQELVQLYSDADVFVNPTYSDNFPTTNLEALACGTPVITYRTGGSVEAISSETGMIVEQGDLRGLSKAIQEICGKGKGFYQAACCERAIKYFNKNNCYQEYMKLYDSLLNSK